MSNVPAFSINRSLNNVLSELEFLRETQVITPELYNQIVNKIPRTYEQGMPAVGPFELAPGSTANPPSYQSNSTTTVARSDEKQVQAPQQPPPQQQQPQQPTGGEVVEALYAYQPAAPTDLPLYPGQRINIVEKLNADWWRGRDAQTGQEGIFPANYVRVSQQQAPPPQQQQGYQAYDNRGGYGAPPPPSYGAASYQYSQPPPQQQQPQQQQPFPPPSVNYYQPPAQQPQQQQPQQVVVQEQPQQPQQHSAVADGAKKFGSKLGNAAIFGAGATIGSNIVNSIF